MRRKSYTLKEISRYDKKTLFVEQVVEKSSDYINPISGQKQKPSKIIEEIGKKNRTNFTYMENFRWYQTNYANLSLHYSQ